MYINIGFSLMSFEVDFPIKPTLIHNIYIFKKTYIPNDI